ncbi:hypothetical protein QFC19_001458 [Naganishia cerealis]|uniref:Uncharacterized protein n=1 Tax=Naganishia cerealis TaxID=610337 RepID=A0ACC2WHF1_9TREE|nr:hypothetical protein QFC19_001458 [Naganishia cerealis]
MVTEASASLLSWPPDDALQRALEQCNQEIKAKVAEAVNKHLGPVLDDRYGKQNDSEQSREEKQAEAWSIASRVTLGSAEGAYQAVIKMREDAALQTERKKLEDERVVHVESSVRRALEVRIKEGIIRIEDIPKDEDEMRERIKSFMAQGT